MARDSNPVSTHFENNARVWLRSESGVLRSCENHVETEILRGLIAKSTDCIPILRDDHSDSIPASSSILTCDFFNMKLTDGETGLEEDIVIDLPWNSKALSFVVLQGNDRTLKQKVLTMALLRIQSQSILKNLLAAKGVPFSQIWGNPNLRPGHEPFENFLKSLLDHFGTGRDPGANSLFEHFLEMADEVPDQNNPNDWLEQLQRGGINFAFHGTNHGVMDGILDTGLDPRRRHISCSHGDYFAADFGYSLQVSKERTRPPPSIGEPWKILFFMIIRPVRVGSRHYVVADNKYQLPLAKFALTG